MAKAKTSGRPNLKLVRGSDKPTGLGAEIAQFVDEMFDAWYERRVGSRGHTVKSVMRDLKVVSEFTRISGKPPWNWSEKDFDRWCMHLGRQRKLAVATQRQYQSAVRNFLDFLVTNRYYVTEVPRRFGRSVRQIVTRDNSIPHIAEVESRKIREGLTHEQILHFFAAADEEIREAKRFRAKSFHPAQRDKVLFYLTYVTGARVGEVRGIDLNSFLPNPDFPRFGDFGRVSVWGKGSKGSGPRQRWILIDHPDLPPLLEWYVESVRPHFLRHADPNEVAFFLSQHGKRLGQSSFNQRFNKIADRAGLEAYGFTPHCLRHSTLTHGRMLTTVEMQQRKAGHRFAATTEGYTHFGDDFMRDTLREVIQKQLDEDEES